MKMNKTEMKASEKSGTEPKGIEMKKVDLTSSAFLNSVHWWHGNGCLTRCSVCDKDLNGKRCGVSDGSR